VAGAALRLHAYPLASPYDIKARLMNTAETNILASPKTAPGQLASITRIGAGEVRVSRAHQTQNVYPKKIEEQGARSAIKT